MTTEVSGVPMTTVVSGPADSGLVRIYDARGTCPRGEGGGEGAPAGDPARRPPRGCRGGGGGTWAPTEAAKNHVQEENGANAKQKGSPTTAGSGQATVSREHNTLGVSKGGVGEGSPGRPGAGLGGAGGWARGEQICPPSQPRRRVLAKKGGRAGNLDSAILD
uniref:Uncharacterized protein n=1 Tax=Pipistrellus kuhlii TaxID=59472 RepID=A0A7J7QVF0_PIPKU|nr:hypothetical protein mPipKuh1_008343 [Pipistrellus kuhlii]